MRRDMAERLGAYITERYLIRERRRQGLAREDWTQDPILREWRFTNVRRAWDKTTVWIGQWSRPYREHPLLPMNLALGRFINWPDTLHELGFQQQWRPTRTINRLEARARRGEKVWTGAYMIHGGYGGTGKPRHVIDNVLTPLRALLAPDVLRRIPSMADYHDRMRGFYGVGDFMAQEIGQDLVLYGDRFVAHWPDAGTFVVCGPGAYRGLSRVMGRPLLKRVPQAQARDELQQLRVALRPLVPSVLNPLTLHDVEFNLCEFDKYERVRLGEGTPKSRYRLPSGEVP